MILALIADPMMVTAYLMGLLAFIFWISSIQQFSKFFDYLPAIFWAYFLPMLSTTFGITSEKSEVYDWVKTYMLPFSLFLLMLTMDVPAVLRLGWKASAMMVGGTIGVILGCIISFSIFGAFLPENAWRQFAALSGSWIGGSMNMIAIAQGLGENNLTPVIAVDTIVAYLWMATLLSMSAYQKWYNDKYNADTTVIDELTAKMEAMEEQKRPIKTSDLGIIIGFGMFVAICAVFLGKQMPTIGNPTIIGTSTWAILLVVAAGLVLSFTKIRKVEEAGASSIGYFALYALLLTMGAQGNLRSLGETPIYLLAGVVWLFIHIIVLFGFARLLRAPLFFVATSSMANIGGAASAPVVASAYSPAMAPVGLLMAVAGYILGIYGGLFCAWVLSQIAPML